MDRWVSGWMDGWIVVRENRWVNGRVDGFMSGWVDR
jgi:hypothetical protein